MLSALLAGTARHRRPVLAVAITFAATALGMFPVTEPASVGRLVVMSCAYLPGLGSAVLGLPASLRRPPAAFVVEPGTPALGGLPHAGPVYLAVALTFFSAYEAIQWLDQAMHTRGDPILRILNGASAVLVGGLVGVTALYVVAVWRGIGVQLLPAGVVNRTGLGTLIVPWEALDDVYPTAPGPRLPDWSLVLTYTRPELVRRRGIVFRRHRLLRSNVDPLFLASAIAYYIADPKSRSAIGTEAEYDRMLSAMPVSR